MNRFNSNLINELIASSPSIIKSTTNTTTTSTISTTTQNSSPLKSNSSLTSSHKTDSNNSTPTKTLPKQQLNNTNNNNDNNNNNNNNEISLTSKSLSSRPRHPPPYLEAISKSAMISSTNTNTSHNSQFIQSPDEKSNKRRSLEPSPQTQKQRTNSQKEQLLQRDALRLVDMQKETMKNQEKVCFIAFYYLYKLIFVIILLTVNNRLIIYFFFVEF